jgi:hypothetical protein
MSPQHHKYEFPFSSMTALCKSRFVCNPFQEHTPPNSEIICVQNMGTKVVCGIIFYFKENYAENMKKIVGAV